MRQFENQNMIRPGRPAGLKKKRIEQPSLFPASRRGQPAGNPRLDGFGLPRRKKKDPAPGQNPGVRLPGQTTDKVLPVPAGLRLKNQNRFQSIISVYRIGSSRRNQTQGLGAGSAKGQAVGEFGKFKQLAHGGSGVQQNRLVDFFTDFQQGADVEAAQPL